MYLLALSVFKKATCSINLATSHSAERLSYGADGLCLSWIYSEIQLWNKYFEIIELLKILGIFEIMISFSKIVQIHKPKFTNEILRYLKFKSYIENKWTSGLFFSVFIENLFKYYRNIYKCE